MAVWWKYSICKSSRSIFISTKLLCIPKWQRSVATGIFNFFNPVYTTQCICTTISIRLKGFLQLVVRVSHYHHSYAKNPLQMPVLTNVIDPWVGLVDNEINNAVDSSWEVEIILSLWYCKVVRIVCKGLWHEMFYGISHKLPQEGFGENSIHFIPSWLQFDSIDSYWNVPLVISDSYLPIMELPVSVTDTDIPSDIILLSLLLFTCHSRPILSGLQ